MKKHRLLLIVAVGVILVGGPTAYIGLQKSRQVPTDPAWQGFDSELRQSATSGTFSGTVLIVKGGQPLLLKGYGWADKNHNVANTPDTKFCIASMGKMFTAVAIAQLVQQGKLSFDDTIGRYVSGFPPEVANKVTIAQLLTHTSGMGDTGLGRADGPPPATLAGLMQRVVKAPLAFVPGTRFSYSNDGFIVLGAVIEHVSGQSYEAYIRQRIFQPAEMKATEIRAYKPTEVADMAHGYMLVDDSGQPVPPGPRQGTGNAANLRDNSQERQVGNPSGGAFSTVRDMLNFATALTAHKLLNAEMTNTILTGKVDSRRPGGPVSDKYAYGFADIRLNGVRIVGHNGGTPGYEAQLDVYPDHGYVVVVLTNQDGVMNPVIRKIEEMLTAK